MITSDEAWIYLSRQHGKRTIQYLKQEQKRSEAEVQANEHYPKKLMVWVAFSADHVFKPMFVELVLKLTRNITVGKSSNSFQRISTSLS